VDDENTVMFFSILYCRWVINWLIGSLFQVANGESIRVHSVLLASISPLFVAAASDCPEIPDALVFSDQEILVEDLKTFFSFALKAQNSLEIPDYSTLYSLNRIRRALSVPENVLPSEIFESTNEISQIQVNYNLILL